MGKLASVRMNNYRRRAESAVDGDDELVRSVVVHWAEG